MPSVAGDPGAGRRWLVWGFISAEQAEDVIRQLKVVASAGDWLSILNARKWRMSPRITCGTRDLVDMVDEPLAFQVNASSGTQDTADKARLKSRLMAH